MIPLARLLAIRGSSRLRKAAVVLASIERSLLSGEADGTTMEYLGALARALPGDAGIPGPCASAARELGSLLAAREAGSLPGAGSDPELLRALDRLRHLLMAGTGQRPADWDLIDPSTGRANPLAAPPVEGMRLYLEDIRSPFNLGSMFRTADAFGVGEILLSAECAGPDHPRALRSAMGAIDTVPYRRAGLEALGDCGPAFALELGGVPISEFAFPRRGIAVLGSEELGVSAPALGRCALGRVSIPMYGRKASLNVAVACGILLSAWRASFGPGDPGT